MMKICCQGFRGDFKEKLLVSLWMFTNHTGHELENAINVLRSRHIHHVNQFFKIESKHSPAYNDQYGAIFLTNKSVNLICVPVIIRCAESNIDPFAIEVCCNLSGLFLAMT